MNLSVHCVEPTWYLLDIKWIGIVLSAAFSVAMANQKGYKDEQMAEVLLWKMFREEYPQYLGDER
jgi:hypothetical protein